MAKDWGENLQRENSLTIHNLCRSGSFPEKQVPAKPSV